MSRFSDFRYIMIRRDVYLVLDESDDSIMGLWGRVSAISSFVESFIPFPDSNWILCLFSGCMLSFPNSGAASSYMNNHFKL